MYQKRQARLAVLQAVERRVKQFRTHENLFTFRVPHEPLDLDEIVRDALVDAPVRVVPDDLRSRTVVEMTFEGGHRWEAWAISFASGVHVYCDDDGHETRVLASLRRGNPGEADRFFLELLAETHGHAFGIEMGGALPEQVRTPIDDREFLGDVFIELFEGTAAERALRARGGDFRVDVVRWLERVLVAPPSRGRRTFKRLRDDA
jgi:hypothetical protein